MTVCILAHEGKVITVVAIVSSGCFIDSWPPCWCPSEGHQYGLCIYTVLYKSAWNVSANNSRRVYRTDLRLGEGVYLLIFCKMKNS